MNLYADLLFTGGAIYTADPARPWAAAVAVRRRSHPGRGFGRGFGRAPGAEHGGHEPGRQAPAARFHREPRPLHRAGALAPAQVEATEALGRRGGRIGTRQVERLQVRKPLQDRMPGLAAAAGCQHLDGRGGAAPRAPGCESRPRRRSPWTARRCTRSGSTVRRCG